MHLLKSFKGTTLSVATQDISNVFDKRRPSGNFSFEWNSALSRIWKFRHCIVRVLSFILITSSPLWWETIFDIKFMLGLGKSLHLKFLSVHNLSPRTTVDCNLHTQQRNIMSGKLQAICKAKPKISLCPYWNSNRNFLFKLRYRALSLLGTRQALNCSRNLLFHTIQRFPAAFTATC
jgi:hypothetical protein